MPRPSAPSKPRKTAPRAKGRPVPARPAAKAAVPLVAERPAVEEPVWLVRVVLVLFFVGFAAFLAREAYSFVQSLP